MRSRSVAAIDLLAPERGRLFELRALLGRDLGLLCGALQEVEGPEHRLDR
jgi:hypothetical protein